MGLVGAPVSFIRGPFVMEGALQGALGALARWPRWPRWAGRSAGRSGRRWRPWAPRASGRSPGGTRWGWWCWARGSGRWPDSWPPGAGTPTWSTVDTFVTPPLHFGTRRIHAEDDRPHALPARHPRFLPPTLSSSDFYREEFVKHQECLDAAARILLGRRDSVGRDRPLPHHRGDRRPHPRRRRRHRRGPPPQRVRRRDPAFGLDRPAEDQLSRRPRPPAVRRPRRRRRRGRRGVAARPGAGRADRRGCRPSWTRPGRSPSWRPARPPRRCTRPSPTACPGAVTASLAVARTGPTTGRAAPWVTGGHPFATDGSVEAARRALRGGAVVGPAGRLIVLLSGGASALMAAPAHGLTLAVKQQTARTLMTSGADDHRAERRAQASLGGEGRPAGGGVPRPGDHAGDLRRRRRRPERDRLGPRRARSVHVARHARRAARLRRRRGATTRRCWRWPRPAAPGASPRRRSPVTRRWRAAART